MEVNLIDRPLEVQGTQDGHLVWPAEWTDELERIGAIDAAMAILQALPACALKTPWIIGSASKTLWGDVRTESASHLEGRAFDMSPMYSDVEILDPEKRIMGLAWNVVSLDIISKAYSKYPHFVVEGDHIHVQAKSQLPEDGLLAAMTMPSWYPWTDLIRQDDAQSEIDNSFWIWSMNEPKLELAQYDVLKAYINALNHDSPAE